MTQCTDLELFLDRRLDPDRRALFQAHLSRCPKCRAEAEHWQGVQDAFASWMATRTGGEEPPRASDAVRIVASITERLQPRTRQWATGWATRPAVWAAAAVALIAIGLGARLVLREAKFAEPVREKRPLVVAATILEPGGPRSITLEQPWGQTLEAPTRGRVIARVGTDRIGLGRGSQVRVIELAESRTRLRLERGTVACLVSGRAQKGLFAIEAGRFTVRVKGTRFLVRRASDHGLAVSVSEGVVEVERSGRLVTRIRAGKSMTFLDTGRMQARRMEPAELKKLSRLLDESESEVDDSPGKAPPQVETPLVPELRDAGRTRAGRMDRGGKPRAGEGGGLRTWHKWVFSGRLQEAERELTRFLRRSPDDEEAWSLLATCQRKAGKFEQAVESYRRVAALAGTSGANRARFMAASLLQDRIGNHAEAAALLREYLEQSRERTPTRAEAMMRLARSLVALGQKNRARELLREVAETQGRTPVAIRARTLLEQLANPENSEGK